MINRWGHEIKRGMRVICQHPRGGVVFGTVARVYRLSGYGYRVDLKEGGSFGLDDAKPAPTVADVLDEEAMADYTAQCAKE